MTTHPVHSMPEQRYEVTPLELFFDLVFAFALSQLSQHLLTHLSWRGAVETLVLINDESRRSSRKRLFVAETNAVGPSLRHLFLHEHITASLILSARKLSI